MDKTHVYVNKETYDLLVKQLEYEPDNLFVYPLLSNQQAVILPNPIYLTLDNTISPNELVKFKNELTDLKEVAEKGFGDFLNNGSIPSFLFEKEDNK